MNLGGKAFMTDYNSKTKYVSQQCSHCGCTVLYCQKVLLIMLLICQKC